MTIDREKLRAAAAGTARKPVEPLTRADLREATVAAFDQSLGATGLVVLRHTEAALTVEVAKTFKLDSELAGHRKNYELAEKLFHLLDRELAEIGFYFGSHVEVVHEAPISGAGKIKHPESSVMAGREVQRATFANDLVLTDMIGIGAHKTLVGGHRTITKSQLRGPLKLLADALPITGYPLVTNEATRDALCVGIAALHRRGDDT